MAARAAEHVRGSAPATNGSTIERWAADRRAYLDHLKVILWPECMALFALGGRGVRRFRGRRQGPGRFWLAWLLIRRARGVGSVL